ncbi:MAG: YicC family protein [Synergistales bacterium]|nr:YicC family protein [Synergistales bacterium]
MLNSMTGFSRVSRDYQWGSVIMELSTVNHRYLEISIRVPKELSSFEPMLNQQLRKAFVRGKVRLRVELLLASTMKAARIDPVILQSYFREIDSVREELDLNSRVEIGDLLDLPGVLDSPSLTAVLDAEGENALAETLKEAVSSVKIMREMEGRHLLEDVLMNLENYRAHISSIEEAWEISRESALQGLKDRIADLMEGMNYTVDEGRLAQEIAIMSDKWDISEELSRTRSHLDKFDEILKETDALGRKLDFLIQEMNREINTIASKVSDSQIRWLAVEGKTTLEKIREQVQNVE